MSASVEDGPDRVEYPGFGRCIYCGSDGGADGLRFEHPIPRSLGGKLEIKDGSCKACEHITHKLDGLLANAVFFELRVAKRIRSRSGTTKVNAIPLTYRLNDGTPATEDVLIEKRPYQVHYPDLPPPTVLSATKPVLNYAIRGTHSYIWFPNDFRETLGAGERDKIDIASSRPSIDLTKFARAIAKWAYGLSIRHHKIKEFQKTEVTEFIRGKYPFAPHIVGCVDASPEPATPSNIYHSLQFKPVFANNRWYSTCNVRPFSFCKDKNTGAGPPAYQVVLGDITEARRKAGLDPPKSP